MESRGVMVIQSLDPYGGSPAAVCASYDDVVEWAQNKANNWSKNKKVDWGYIEMTQKGILGGYFNIGGNRYFFSIVKGYGF